VRKKIVGQLAHLHQEAEVALLDRRASLGPLEYLNQADRLAIGFQQGEN
jgi:hypothetical protein